MTADDIIKICEAVVVVIGAIFALISYFKNKSMNLDKILSVTDKTLKTVEPFIEVAKSIPSVKTTASLIDWIEEKAAVGVKVAEQLQHSGEIKTNEEKFNIAENTVYAALKEIKVEPDDNKKMLIKYFIEEAVSDLRHNSEKMADENIQIENEKLEKIEQELDLLTLENENIKEEITLIQNPTEQDK